MALTTAFARNGNKKAVPQTTADGSVSYDQGFGNLYALPPEEGGLFIDRAQFNQIMFDTTSAVISNQNSITTLNSKVTANQNSINTLNSKVADLESGISTGVVNLTGNQTIQGVKTFSSPPISATNPTANNQVANKAYVDTVANTKANANATVNLTGNQTIAGTKTFSSPVVVPDATATTHAVNLAQLNTKANWNAVVNLTGNQSIAGAKTFTSNIAAPNITTMQNSINTINTSLSTVVSDSFTPYLILKSSPLGFRAFSIQNGAGQDEINSVINQAVRYRFYRLYLYGTITGDINIQQAEYADIIFDTASNAKLVGNLNLSFQTTAKVISPTIQNGQFSLRRYSRAYFLSGCNITAPASKPAIVIGNGSSIFTDEFPRYPLKPLNLTSDTYGINLDNCSTFIAGRNLQIQTTNTTYKVFCNRGSIATMTGTTLSGDGTDFNIALNTPTASGLILR